MPPRRPLLPLLWAAALLAAAPQPAADPGTQCDATKGEEDLGLYFPAETISVPAYAVNFWLLPQTTAATGGRRLASSGQILQMSIDNALRGSNFTTLRTLVAPDAPDIIGGAETLEAATMQLNATTQAFQAELTVLKLGLEQQQRELASITQTQAGIAAQMAKQAEVQAYVARLQARLGEQFTAVQQVMEDRHRQTTQTLQDHATRIALIEFDVYTGRQFTRRLSHLDNNGALVTEALTSPVARKFFQTLSLQRRAHPDLDPGMVGPPYPLYFYRPLHSLSEEPDLLNGTVRPRFAGRVCRLEVRRVWSPRFFLDGNKQHSYFLESTPECYAVQDTQCLPLGGSGSPGAIDTNSPHCWSAGGRLADVARCLAHVRASAVQVCLKGQLLQDVCNQPRCDPYRMWLRSASYLSPNASKGRVPFTGDSALRPCQPDSVCGEHQGHCLADADCQAHLQCGPANSCPWDQNKTTGRTYNRCCVPVPSRGCTMRDTQQAAGGRPCCVHENVTDDRKCGMRWVAGEVVTEGTCSSVHEFYKLGVKQCAGTLSCGIGQCAYEPPPWVLGIPFNVGCCFDRRRVPTCVPSDTATCDANVDLVGDGLTVLTSAPLAGAAAGGYTDAREEFQGRGVFFPAGTASTMSFGLVYFDPMEITNLNQRVTLPEMQPEFEALWRSGNFGLNLGSMAYGPQRQLTLGRHLHSGRSLVLHADYVQHSEALLAFFHGEAARAMWSPANDSTCRLLAQPGALVANVTRVCCSPLARLDGAPAAPFQAHAEGLLLGLRTTLVDTRSLVEEVRFAAPNATAGAAARLVAQAGPQFAELNASEERAFQEEGDRLRRESQQRQAELGVVRADMLRRAAEQQQQAADLRNRTLFPGLPPLQLLEVDQFLRGLLSLPEEEVELSPHRKSGGFCADLAAGFREEGGARPLLGVQGDVLRLVRTGRDGVARVAGAVSDGLDSLAETLSDPLTVFFVSLGGTLVLGGLVVGLVVWVRGGDRGAYKNLDWDAPPSYGEVMRGEAGGTEPTNPTQRFRPPTNNTQ